MLELVTEDCEPVEHIDTYTHVDYGMELPVKSLHWSESSNRVNALNQKKVLGFVVLPYIR